MTRANFGALLWLLALALGSPALAQQAYNNPIVAPDPTGAPSPPHKEVDLIGDILYNSNVASGDAEVAAQRKLTPQDEIFTPSIDFDLVRPLGNGNAFLKGNAGYNFYAHNTVLDRENINVTGGVTARLLLCRNTLAGGWTAAQSDLNTTSVLVTKNTQMVERVSLAGTCLHSVGFAPNYSVSETWTGNSAAALQLNNERTFTATAGLGYQRPTFGSLGVFGEFDQITFENRTIFIPGQGFDNYTGGVRYQRAVGSRLQGQASISYTSLQPFHQGGKTFEGITYSVSGTYQASSRLSAHAAFSRATVPSTFVNASFSINETEEADVGFLLSRRVRLSLTGSAETVTYEGVLLNPAIDLTHENIYNLNTTLSFNLNERYSLALTVGDQKRDANTARLSYSSFTAGLQGKAAF